ncbi:MAG TPA: TrkA C-terminal domain-containing protein [Victivallales bacterium]|nr:TrkA C-terminal domain-containing protein [Victivallales bacterium]
MIYFFIILIILGISFFIVRIGGIAFELTGMATKQANFQSLSCFTGTGFTTRKSELVVNHPIRRRIASTLMVAGNIVFVTMIGSVVNTLASNRDLREHISLTLFENEIRIHYSLVLLVEVILIVIFFRLFYLFFTKSVIWRNLQIKIKEKMAEMTSFSRMNFEEFLVGANDCGIIKVEVKKESIFCDKNLIELNFRTEFGGQVLAIERKGNIIYNPPAGEKIEKGDYLIIFGKLSEISEKIKKSTK